MHLTAQDVEFEATRSSGPGGQNVNKRSTAVRLRCAIDALDLSDEEKEALREHLPPRHLTKDGEILVENSEARTQEQNRKNALRIANEEIEEALRRARRKREEEAHRKRARTRGGKGGGSGRGDDLKERQKRARRSERTEDLLERAYREDPDLWERIDEE